VVDYPSGSLPDGNLFRLEGGTLLPMFRVFGKRAKTLILFKYFYYCCFVFFFFFGGSLTRAIPADMQGGGQPPDSYDVKTRCASF
jgi:hypothetical protein